MSRCIICDAILKPEEIEMETDPHLGSGLKPCTNCLVAVDVAEAEAKAEEAQDEIDRLCSESD